MQTFNEYVDKKERESKKHLKIVKKALESSDYKVSEHLTDDDPYIFVFSPEKNLSFEGVRVYKIAGSFAYRIQKEEKTQPFGDAYPLDIEEMFEDLMTDNHNPEKAGKEVVKAISETIKKFFTGTAKAEKDLMSSEFDRNNPMGQVAVRSGDTDYSSMIFSKG